VHGRSASAIRKATATRPPTGGSRKKVDYRDTLSETQFALFAKFRTLRKMLADQEGVPAYALFTNEQLADMVHRPVLSLEGLASIDGVGQARAEKYGAAFLCLLKEPRQALTNGVSGAGRGRCSNFPPRCGMKMSKQGSRSKLAPTVSSVAAVGKIPRRSTCGPATATTTLASAARTHADVG
jgi:hypothetical protein